MRLVLLIALSTGCGWFGDAADADGGPPAALVSVATARAGTLSDTWTLLGDVRALERAELAAGASGPVAKVSVREGDAVAKDALLLEVDTSVASAALARARADAKATREELDQARRELKRLGGVAPDVLAPAELERSKASVATLESRYAALDAASREAAAVLERHRVKAPFSGVISGRHVDPGDWVTPGTPVLDLVSADSVEVVVHAPLDLVRGVAVGDAVTLDGTPPVPGIVVGVVPALDPVERTSVVRVSPTEDTRLLPGTPVGVGFGVAHDVEGAVVVPRDALILGPVRDQVAMVVEGHAKLVDVDVLARNDAEVLVVGEGVHTGAIVVVRGNERLRPDQAVTVTGD